MSDQGNGVPSKARRTNIPQLFGSRIRMYSCYLLRCADDSFYVGVAEDPLRRCIEHNRGKGATWTAARRPVQLIWIEQHASLSSARKRENQIKRWSHAKKEALIGTTLALTSTHA